MKRLIITIILGILITSLAGCVGYRHHYPHGRQVVIVTSPKHPPMPPAHPRSPHGYHAPPPMPRQNRHRY